MQWSESMRNCRYHNSKAPKVDGIDIIHDSTSWCIKAPVQRVKMSTQPVKLNSFYKTLYWNLHCEETMGLLSICSPAFWAPFFWSAKPLTFSPFASFTNCAPCGKSLSCSFLSLQHLADHLETDWYLVNLSWMGQSYTIISKHAVK